MFNKLNERSELKTDRERQIWKKQIHLQSYYYFVF